jgi:signal transduction histidine kinase
MMVIIVLLALVLVGVLTIVHMQMKRLGGSVHELLERMQRFALDRESPPVEPDSVPRELAPLAEAMNQLATRAHEAYGEVNLSLQQQSHLREELQAVTRRLLTVQEDERHTLSRELHDDIGQAITAIKLSAHAAMGEPDQARRQDDLQFVADTADATLDKLRNLSMLLRPPQLDALGLEAALRWHAGVLLRNAPLQLELDIHDLPQRPEREVEQACFRIAQEGLTNVLRHARASTVSLSLEEGDDGGLRLRIEDDGRGFEPADANGLGLVIMRERAQSVGGQLRIDALPGRGTRIHLQLPYAQQSLH